MPLESRNLYPVRSAHRVVSTDSLIMPIVSEREKELARTYIFFRTFTSESINFRRKIPLCSLCSLRTTIRTLAEVNLARLSCPFSFAGKT